MRRAKPKHLTPREREQQAEMERRKKLFAAMEIYPTSRLCAPCQNRDAWQDICPDCRAKIKEYAGG